MTRRYHARRRAVGLLAPVLGLALVGGCSGSAVPTGFRLSDYVSGPQQNPGLAVAADGSFVLVWEVPDTEQGYQVFGQRIDAHGRAVGAAADRPGRAQ